MDVVKLYQRVDPLKKNATRIDGGTLLPAPPPPRHATASDYELKKTQPI